VNYGFFHLHGQIVWRFPIALQIVFVLFTLATLPFLPESPRYLYFKDRTEDGNAVLAALKGQPVDSEIVQAEAAEIWAAIEMENNLRTAGLKDILLNRSGDQILKRLILVIVIQAIQEMTGVSRRTAPGMFMLTGSDPNRCLLQLLHFHYFGNREQAGSHPGWSCVYRLLPRLHFGCIPYRQDRPQEATDLRYHSDVHPLRKFSVPDHSSKFRTPYTSCSVRKAAS
jgi:hypothetical protein